MCTVGSRLLTSSAGYEPVSRDGSSVELQRQFVEQSLEQLGNHCSNVVFWNWFLLVDFNFSSVINYGIKDPLFYEYLGTLLTHVLGEQQE